MKTMSKSDLKTGYILTFDDDKKGIVIKDINGDTSQSLILFIKDNKIDDVARINTETNDDLYCRAYKEKNLVKVEKLEDEYLLGELLKPSNNYYTVDSVPKTTLCKKVLYKGDTFYVIEPCQVFDGESINNYSIEDIYVTDNTTFLVTTTGQEFDVRNVYFTREEAKKAFKK